MRNKIYFVIPLVIVLTMITANGQFAENYLLVFPSFTDSDNSNSWRSWICISNPWIDEAHVYLDLRDLNGVPIGNTTISIPSANSVSLRPKSIVGHDCSGNAAVVSDVGIVGILEKTRNTNQMTSAYNGYLFYIGPQQTQANEQIIKSDVASIYRAQ